MKLPKDPDKKLYKVSFDFTTYIYGDRSKSTDLEFLEFAKKCFKHDILIASYDEVVEELKISDLKCTLADNNFASGWSQGSFPYELLNDDFASMPDTEDLEMLVLFNEISKSVV